MHVSKEKEDSDRAYDQLGQRPRKPVQNIERVESPLHTYLRLPPSAAGGMLPSRKSSDLLADPFFICARGQPASTN